MRLMYIGEKLRRPFMRRPTLLLSSAGALLALWLIGERIVLVWLHCEELGWMA